MDLLRSEARYPVSEPSASKSQLVGTLEFSNLEIVPMPSCCPFVNRVMRLLNRMARASFLLVTRHHAPGWCQSGSRRKPIVHRGVCKCECVQQHLRLPISLDRLCMLRKLLLWPTVVGEAYVRAARQCVGVDGEYSRGPVRRLLLHRRWG